MEIMPKHNLQNKYGKTEHMNNKMGQYMQQTFELNNFNSFNNQTMQPTPDPVPKNVHEFVFANL